MNWITKIKSMCGFDTDSSSTNTSTDYNNMKVAELKAIAKAQGIKGYYRLRRAELITTLSNTQQEIPQ